MLKIITFIGKFNFLSVCSSWIFSWILPSPLIETTLLFLFINFTPMLAGKAYPIGEFPNAENNCWPYLILKPCIVQVRWEPVSPITILFLSRFFDNSLIKKYGFTYFDLLIFKFEYENFSFRFFPILNQLFL